MSNMPLLAGMVAAVIVVGIVLLVILSRAQPKARLNQEWYAERWRAIEQQLEDGRSGQILAVVNADKLLDHAMQGKHFRGKTMGERLKNHPTAFADINAIWRAHKLRNRIAHEQSQAYEAECRSAVATLRQGLKDLGALR